MKPVEPPATQVQQNMSKKRTLLQMQQNRRAVPDVPNKHRKVNLPQLSKPLTPTQSSSKPSLPWDLYHIIIDFYPLNSGLYKTLRLVSRDFYRFICKRRTSLILNESSISQRVFFDLVEKSTGAKRSPLVFWTQCKVKQFAILKNIDTINATAFNKFIVPIKGLLQLDVQNFTRGIGEQGLNRLLMGCRSTLKYIALPFGSASVNQVTLSTVGTMPNLESIYLGKPQQLIKNNDKLAAIKCMFSNGKL